MARRRRPDSWAHIHAGDIISFDTKSPRCPHGAYVYDVRVREDGRHVVTHEAGKEVVEHSTYRMRLSERSLTLRLREDGPLAFQHASLEELLTGWGVRANFDWEGRQPPTFLIEAMRPLVLRLRANWNVRRTIDLTADTDLLLEAWGERQEPAPGQLFGEPRGWRRFNPETRRLEPFDVEQVAYPEIRAYAPQNPHAFGEIDQHPDVIEKLTAVLGWIYDHRYELDDPGQALRPRAA